MTLDVICFGALNVDKVHKVDYIAKVDEESLIQNFSKFAGGSAANVAVGLSRLGIRTGYIGKVASDSDGKFLIRSFQEEGVDTNGIILSGIGKSGNVLCFVDEEGDRALYLNPGVNNTLYFDEINTEYASKAKLIHLSSFASQKAFKAQKQLIYNLSKIMITLDPGTIYSRKTIDDLKPLLERCSVFFPNKIEIHLLTGENYRAGAKKLVETGVETVAVKLGSNGCYVTNGETDHLIKPYKVNVVDSTGAGDAFCCGFIYGLLKNKSLNECGILGNFVASRTIMQMGARKGLPRKEHLPL